MATENRKLKGKPKSASSYGTLPDLETKVDVDEDKRLLEYSSNSEDYSELEKSGYQSSAVTSQTSRTSKWSQTSRNTSSYYASHRNSAWSAKSSTKGKYELWMPRSRNESCDSIDSGSSDELFSRSSNSSRASHCHDIINEGSVDTNAVFKLTLASIFSLVFMVLEYVGGYYSSSLAVLSDAGHLLSDFCGFMVSLVALHLIRRPPSRAMSFGYYRAEVLGSIASVLIVWVVTGLLLSAAVQRVLEPDYTLDPNIMLIMACVGIVINLFIAGLLHGCGCSGFYHGVHKSATKNVNLRAALVHVIADTLQTLAVLIAALVVKFKPEYKIADPILTFVFGVIVVVTTLPILCDLAHILMEGTPRNIDYIALLNDLEGLPGVRAVHNLHVWSLTLDKNALSAHLVIDQSFESETVLEEAQILIRKDYSVCKSTIQVERYAKEMDSCSKCQPIT